MTRNNYCKGLCTTPELNGIKRYVSHYFGISMYTEGYCFCDRCQLYFTAEAQRSKKNGLIRFCRCCSTRLRFKPTSGRKHNKFLDAVRDAKRY